MSVATDLLVPALREVREAEAALADRFKDHLAVTPPGEHRDVLERRLGDARGHVYRIDERLNTLQPRGLVQSVLGGAWQLTGQAARLPFDMVLSVPAAVFRSRATATELRLLKNAEDEYAVTALALAVCRAAGRIARKAGDTVSVELLSTIRRDSEETLEELAEALEQHAEAAVAASEAMDGGVGGAGVAVREWRSWLRETAERMPGADRLQGPPRGALITEEELPIPDYRRLSTKMITDRLPHLTQTDLATVGAYERSHAGRPAVLSRVGALLGPVPWPGYDSMTAEEVLKRLSDAEPNHCRRVLEYERRHQSRSTVLKAAEKAAERVPA
jgi:ferritin-like metal-binding protein YciE